MDNKNKILNKGLLSTLQIFDFYRNRPMRRTHGTGHRYFGISSGVYLSLYQGR